MTDHELTHDAATELLDSALDIGWVIEHYQIKTHENGFPVMELKVAMDPGDNSVKEGRDEMDTLPNKDVIRLLEGKYADGVPKGVAVQEIAAVRGIPETAAQDEIDRLKQTGDIYEPSAGRFRTT